MVDGATQYQVYLRFRLVDVPYLLHVREDGVVDAPEFLKLVNHEYDMSCLRQLHQIGEDAGKSCGRAKNRHVQLLGYLVGEVTAQFCLRLS